MGDIPAADLVDVMTTLIPSRSRVWMRSGSALMCLSHPCTRPDVPRVIQTSMMTNPALKENEDAYARNDTRTEGGR